MKVVIHSNSQSKNESFGTGVLTVAGDIEAKKLLAS